ncbi:MAG: glycosyltransferase family 4 protein [Desulfobacteraceae bacterium]
MKKIIYFVSEDWYFCSHRLPIARAAKKSGFEVVVVTNVDKHEKIITSEGFRLIPIKLNRRGKNPLKELNIIFNLIRIFKKEKPDIVHNVALKPVIYGSVAAFFSPKSYVVNALAGLGYIFSGNNFFSSFSRSVFIGIYKLIFFNKKTIGLFQNPEDKNIFISKKILPKERTELIKGSGVDVKQYEHKEDSEETYMKILIASRMLWSKGIGDLIKASHILAQKKIKFKTIIVGKPDTCNPDSIPLEKLEEWSKLPYVEYLGYQSQMHKIIKNSNIIALPTTYGEGVPKFLIEAASSGRPIVTNNEPGCKEIVKNGVNGFLVPAKNIEKLADALELLILNRDLRLKFGKAGRKIVENEFSEEIVIEKTLNLYKSLLNK